jgi:hypothetical protein
VNCSLDALLARHQPYDSLGIVFNIGLAMELKVAELILRSRRDRNRRLLLQWFKTGLVWLWPLEALVAAPLWAMLLLGVS